MRKCQLCKLNLEKKYNERPITFKKRQFCGNDCYHLFQKEHPNSGTFKLGNPAPKTAFKKNQSAWNKGISNYWCIGNKNVNWRGGKCKSRGYILIFNANHPYSNSKGYIPEHRFLVEQILGRYLTKSEKVHHLNGIKSDNRIENLYLFPNNIEHSRYHKNFQCGNIGKLLKSNIFYQATS